MSSGILITQMSTAFSSRRRDTKTSRENVMEEPRETVWQYIIFHIPSFFVLQKSLIA